jgi:hypothetical protein
VATVLLDTGFVPILNVAEVFPPSTLTDASTRAAAALLDRVTLKPPDGALDVSVTVPVKGVSPVTEVLESVNPETLCAADKPQTEKIKGKTTRRLGDAMRKKRAIEFINVL